MAERRTIVAKVDQFIKAHPELRSDHAPPFKFKQFDYSFNGVTFASHHRADRLTISKRLRIHETDSTFHTISKKETTQQTLQHTRFWWKAQVVL
jgi:hypothetical protein